MVTFAAMKKFFKILLRLWCLRKAMKLDDYSHYSNCSDMLCFNAETILNYIMEGSLYTPEDSELTSSPSIP